MSQFLKTFDVISDAQLRSTVKLLGKLLGNVIRTHAGSNVFLAVEKLRRGFIRLHKDNDKSKHSLAPGPTRIPGRAGS